MGWQVDKGGSSNRLEEIFNKMKSDENKKKNDLDHQNSRNGQ